jgi:hypothetical protein
VGFITQLRHTTARSISDGLLWDLANDEYGEFTRCGLVPRLHREMAAAARKAGKFHRMILRELAAVPASRRSDVAFMCRRASIRLGHLRKRPSVSKEYAKYQVEVSALPWCRNPEERSFHEVVDAISIEEKTLAAARRMDAVFARLQADTAPVWRKILRLGRDRPLYRWNFYYTNMFADHQAMRIIERAARRTRRATK